MEQIYIGLEFQMEHGLIWRVTDKGIEGWYGVTCLKTNAFCGMSTDEIQKYLK